MDVYCIGYDLLKPGQSYDTLIRALEKAGAKKVLYSSWLLRTSSGGAEIRDWVKKFVDTNDRVFVTRVSDWAGYNALTTPDKV